MIEISLVVSIFVLAYMTIHHLQEISLLKNKVDWLMHEIQSHADKIEQLTNRYYSMKAKISDSKPRKKHKHRHDG